MAQSGTPIDPSALFIEFIAEYDRADELCKRVQLFRQEAGIPAINEIRYAGYHLRHAYGTDGRITDTDQLRRAKAHAQRASYEAAEAGLVQALKEISLFKNQYKDVIVTGDVKDYTLILARSDEAQGRLGVRRSLGDGQDLDHVRHMELFEQLSQAANLLHSARPEINKRMRESRTSKRRWLITTAIAITALFIAFFKEKIWVLLGPLLS